MTATPQHKDWQGAVSGLLVTKPGRGLRLTLFNAVVLNALLYATFQVDPWSGFLAMAVVTGLFYSAVMMTTHDAIHHTLTGWYWFDEALPRLFSYFIFWPHGIYSELHLRHHRLNGRDASDPEMPTATRAQYDGAGTVGRWVIRHQWWLALFVWGGFGLILGHGRRALKVARRERRMRRLLIGDACGIAAAIGVTIAVIVYTGVTWRYAVYLMVVERVIGFCQQLRLHVEHYGLFGTHGSLIETRLYNCRNIKTNWIGRRFFNGLNFHSVHHAFPRVPFYHLAEAHARVTACCDAAGLALPTGDGYFHTLWSLARAPVLIDGDAAVTLDEAAT